MGEAGDPIWLDAAKNLRSGQASDRAFTFVTTVDVGQKVAGYGRPDRWKKSDIWI